MTVRKTVEHARLAQTATPGFKRWGPYLSERQWGTVREDYSEHGTAWDSFPHDHARSRAYRWGEDGLAGFSDDQQRLCLALALWNGRDPILKERLFGLTNSEGNHGEDVKELYYYLDATPSHSYAKMLYKYAQAPFPYGELVEENRRRGIGRPEYELIDTGVFDGDRYFDVEVEYAQAAVDEVLLRVTVHNRGSDAAPLHVLPQLWFRNTWSWKDGATKPALRLSDKRTIEAVHPELGAFYLHADGAPVEILFSDNESNAPRLWNDSSRTGFWKDAFHERAVRGVTGAVNPEQRGTKAAPWYQFEVPARGSVQVRVRLSRSARPSFADFDEVFAARIREADEFYAELQSGIESVDARAVQRQAFAGMIWSKQYFYYDVPEWLRGDPSHPPPPASRKGGRNRDWEHLNNADIISMPDKWEYPWYAAWDLAFHCVPLAHLDAAFAKEQLVLLTREWYMHPNGQMPAYEWAFGDVNPPVHAWATWRVFQIDRKQRGDRGDIEFLERVFHKLMLNFTWWVNRKDAEGHNLFSGGFLGLDNIGVFDRSQPLPTGGHLEQADGTAWMAFYSATMLSMALELARENPAYEDMASKFFEHFVAIADAMNTLGGTGLWDDQDGFYYDRLHVGGQNIPLRVRSLVGLAPLFAVEILEDEVINKLPGFKKRLDWFLENRKDLAQNISYCDTGCGGAEKGLRLLAIPSRERLASVLRYMLDENEFLSGGGIRSLSQFHRDQPYVFRADGTEHRVEYTPAESNTGLFGGNSNWRGPVWFPTTFLMIESLRKLGTAYGPTLQVPADGRDGPLCSFWQLAEDLANRMIRIFTRDAHGRRPVYGSIRKFQEDPYWRDLILFHEYFHGDTGEGLGSSHQTGWTGLVASLIDEWRRPPQPSSR